MDIIIACDRQLPIRYYPDEGIWVRRGTHFFNRKLPFFVEVQVMDQVHRIQEYIIEIERQYKSFEMEIIICNKELKNAIEGLLLPYGYYEGEHIYIVK